MLVKDQRPKAQLGQVDCLSVDCQPDSFAYYTFPADGLTT